MPDWLQATVLLRNARFTKHAMQCLSTSLHPKLTTATPSGPEGPEGQLSCLGCDFEKKKKMMKAV
jgi:hypothetical protein